MDEGVAGVIAGIAGLVGAGIGGLASVRHQSRAEHSHWVREQRRQAYGGIIDAYAVFTTSVQRCRTQMLLGRLPAAELTEQLLNELTALILVGAHPQLWGPDLMVERASALTSAAAQVYVVITEWPAVNGSGDRAAMARHLEKLASRNRDVAEARTSFVDGARMTLGRPG
ncbi:hypothetical protein [Streptomyces nigra]|uniref:hypothetical protein n=1 Tax=Streptomyces nigra TaxID=1827580 RepID=UPI0036443144